LRHDSFGAPLAGIFHRGAFDAVLKRTFDVVVSAGLLLLLAPIMLVLAIAIKLDSRGPVFYRSRRVGRNATDLHILKFRKMWHGATGSPLTSARDERFTRLGGLLARTKLDEVPQLWNVLRGEMSLVGPRPEDPAFVELYREPYHAILAARPGITGLSQLAFANESSLLHDGDPSQFYAERLLPQKVRMDRFYVARRSLAMDLRILAWTACVVLLRIAVAVDRQSGRLSVRRRPSRSGPTPATSQELP
jgi:lipopolysaccharide/colanic/teichoic acid biosynthesis glycosyltransferase